MITINRKKIEEYYESEWQDVISSKTLNCLIELTCQAYQLNQSVSPSHTIFREKLRPQALGQI